MRAKVFSAEVVFSFITLFASLAFGTYLSHARLTDPFLYYDTAFVKSTMGANTMVIPDVGPFASLKLVPGRELLMAQFVNMMGIKPGVLQFLPIGAILIGLTWYFLGVRFLRSPFVSCLMALYLVFDLSHASNLYSVFAYALALPLVIAGIVLLTRYFKERDKLEIIIFMLIFIALNSIHYTMTAWLVVFTLGASFTVWLQRRLLKSTKPLAIYPVPYLFLSLLVFYLYFNNTIYRSFLPLISYETFSGAVDRFLGFLSLGPALGSVATEYSPLLFKRDAELGIISFIALIIILIPVALGIFFDVWRVLRKRASRPILPTNLPLVWGIFLLGVADTVAYSIRGNISTKSLSMLFPLLALLYMQRSGRRLIFYGFAVLLVTTSLVKFAVFYKNDYVVSAKRLSSPTEMVRPSSVWLSRYSTGHKLLMLADLGLYGKYLLLMATKEQKPVLQGYSSERLAQVIGASNKTWKNPPDIIAVDMQFSGPTVGFVWTRLDAVRNYSILFKSNKRLDIVYNDGAVNLLKPREP